MRRWCQSKLPPGSDTLYSTKAHSCDAPDTIVRFCWLVIEARNQVVQDEHDPSWAEKGQDDRHHE